MTRCLNGMLSVGDTVVSITTEEYGGLIGVVTEIKPVGSAGRDTENETDDVYVDFENNYSKRREAEILEYFQDLFEDPERTWEECGLDVIMAPKMLLKIDIDSLSEEQYEYLLDSEAAVSRWCIQELLKKDRLEVETPFGQLFAEVGRDPAYPGIYFGLREPAEVCERTFALAESTPNQPEDEKLALRLLVWSNMNDMTDYSNEFVFLTRNKEDGKGTDLL